MCFTFFLFFFLSTLTSRQDRSLAIMQSVSFHPELHASSNLKNLILTLFTGMKILRSLLLNSELILNVPHALSFFFNFLEIFHSLIWQKVSQDLKYVNQEIIVLLPICQLIFFDESRRNQIFLHRFSEHNFIKNND